MEDIEKYFDGSVNFYLFEHGTYLPFRGTLTEDEAILRLQKECFGHVDMTMYHKPDGKQTTWFNDVVFDISEDQSEESAFISRDNLFNDLKNPKIVKIIKASK